MDGVGTAKSMGTKFPIERLQTLVSKSGSMLKEISSTALEAILERGRIVSFHKGHNISGPDQVQRAFYSVLSGSVRMSVNFADGREFVMAFLEPGNMIGLRCCLDMRAPQTDTFAETDVEALMLTAQQLQTLMHENTAVLDAVIAMLCLRMRILTDGIEQFAIWGPRARLAARLILLARTHGQPTERAHEIAISISQESLAAMIGTSRQTVNKLLADLERWGAIRNDYNRIIVGDQKVLAGLLEN